MTDSPDILWRRVRRARRSAPGGQPVILVVDPDPKVRLQVQYALRHDGEVDVATAAADAIRLASDAVYDAVLVSIDLSNEGRDALLEHLHAHDGYRDVPVLAMADGTDNGRDVPDDRRSAFDGCVAKPLDPNSLQARLTRLLARQPAARRRSNTGVRARQPS
ncbi:response regulator [Longibacter sp.]|uniref:response regulator n=1 Tax=Longibacter sp. TaxID=2045415 RepID=UPI003EBFEB63